MDSFATDYRLDTLYKLINIKVKSVHSITSNNFISTNESMKYFYFTFLLLLSYLILSINFKLHTENFNRDDQIADIILQLNFLESELKDNNLGSRMQHIYPEGYVFVYALYGLSWCELAIANPDNAELKSRAIDEALYAYNQLDSKNARWNFPSVLKPEYGIFYNGWRNYLLSRILTADKNFNGSDQYIFKFQNQSDAILEALINSDTPYLESYFGQAWPADMFVAMASICNYDKIIEQKYQVQIKNWLQEVNKHLDKKTHMIPHKVDSETGETIQGARGCSMSLILRMLTEIDSDFARQQFKLFDSLFVDKKLGLPVVREYPSGTRGFGDIDSGPVIFGVGFAATIVMSGTFRSFERYDLATSQYKTIHALGFCRKTKNYKKFLWGKLPMADAFIAWGRTSELKYAIDQKHDDKKLWFGKFHLISLSILIFVWTVYYRKRILRYFKSTSNSDNY
jgi:hypothetical protein